MVVGSSPTRGSQFFFKKNDCLGELCCVALPFCCVVVVALPFSVSLGVIVNVRMILYLFNGELFASGTGDVPN